MATLATMWSEASKGQEEKARFRYERITNAYELLGIHEATVAEGLFPTFNPPGYVEGVDFLLQTLRPEVLVLGGYVGEAKAASGYLVGVQFGQGRTRCMEVAVCAFRNSFHLAAPLSRGGYMWCFDNLECDSLVGRVISSNRHVLRMAPEVGFSDMGEIPGLFWSDRRQKFMGGHLLLATRESVQAAIEKYGEE